MSDRRKVKVRVAVAESGGTPPAGTVLAKSQIESDRANMQAAMGGVDRVLRRQFSSSE